MVFLGDAVWEDYSVGRRPGAPSMTLAFNILVPRKGLWPLLLVIGNLGVLGWADSYKPPGRKASLWRTA